MAMANNNSRVAACRWSMILWTYCCLSIASCFQPSSYLARRSLSSSSTSSPPLYSSIFPADNNDAGESSGGSSFKGDDSDAWGESLRSRLVELGEKDSMLARKWRKAECFSDVAAVLPDYVRRIDVEYPLVACGSSSGDIYVANLETKDFVASSLKVKREDDEDGNDDNKGEPSEEVKKVTRLLFGSFYGAGTIALAFKDGLVAEVSKMGRVNLWRVDPRSNRLISQGTMQAMKADKEIATAVHLDEEYLWIGTSSGYLRAYALDGDLLPLALMEKPEMEWKFDNAVLSLSLSPELSCGVVSTANTVELISLEEDGASIGSFSPRAGGGQAGAFRLPFDFGGARKASSSSHPSSEYPLCATIVPHETKVNGQRSYSVACGCLGGGLFLQPIQMLDGEVDVNRPFIKPTRELKPFHSIAVKCVLSPVPGVLISGGQDGKMRVWNIDDDHCLYQLNGYKAWLGSIWTDGVRIVSDGSDQSVVIHDFEKGGKTE